jgi:uncharacterized protein (DUF433 family)
MLVDIGISSRGLKSELAGTNAADSCTHLDRPQIDLSSCRLYNYTATWHNHSCYFSPIVPNLKFDASRQFEDPREMPAYSIPQVAHYLRIPVSTIDYWVKGYRNKVKDGHSNLKPVINLPDNTKHLLSFYNLAEAHILRAIRTRHNIKLPRIRAAIDFVAEKFGTVHPLVSQQFKTDGVSLFIEHLGEVIEASGSGQRMMRDLMAHLERLDFADNVVARLYPFTRSVDEAASPRSVFIDPRYAFGRPVLSSIFVPTGAIAERYKAGDSIIELAKDYECDRLDIEEAIRCELPLDKAA